MAFASNSHGYHQVRKENQLDAGEKKRGKERQNKTQQNETKEMARLFVHSRFSILLSYVTLLRRKLSDCQKKKKVTVSIAILRYPWPP